MMTHQEIARQYGIDLTTSAQKLLIQHRVSYQEWDEHCRYLKWAKANRPDIFEALTAGNRPLWRRIVHRVKGGSK